MRVGMIQINVTDLVAAKEFYGGALGLDVREPHGPGAPFELQLKNAPVVLVYQVDDAVVSQYENQGTTIVFHTLDLDSTIASWRENGVEFVPIDWSDDESGAADCPYGRFIAFKDPFGNVFELLQPHGGANAASAT